MISMVSLWLPILLSAVVVFVLSSLIHTVLGYHANDLRKLPDEDAVANALRQWNIPAGEYLLPRPGSMKEMKTPEFQEKVKRGPGAPYLSVFRFAGATAFCCYAFGGWQDSIWFKRAWSTSLKNTLDALIYALFTAGMFGWLWPR